MIFVSIFSKKIDLVFRKNVLQELKVVFNSNANQYIKAPPQYFTPQKD